MNEVKLAVSVLQTQMGLWHQTLDPNDDDANDSIRNTDKMISRGNQCTLTCSQVSLYHHKSNNDCPRTEPRPGLCGEMPVSFNFLGHGMASFNASCNFYHLKFCNSNKGKILKHK
jgi:hypothetical protein